MGQLDLDCSNNTFTTDTGTLAKNIPLLDDFDDGEEVPTFRSTNFSISISRSTQVSTISYLATNSFFLDYTLEVSTLGLQNAAEKEVAKEGGIYKSNARRYSNGRLSNGSRFPKRTF